MKADFFRYAVLLAYGGIYADVDTACQEGCGHCLPGRCGHCLPGRMWTLLPARYEVPRFSCMMQGHMWHSTGRVVLVWMKRCTNDTRLSTLLAQVPIHRWLPPKDSKIVESNVTLAHLYKSMIWSECSLLVSFFHMIENAPYHLVFIPCSIHTM